MHIVAGRESEFTKEELRPLEVTKNYNNEIARFPQANEGWHVACAYNQWGMAGMAKIIICQTLEDMNELVRGYRNGGALSMSWVTIPDTHFVKEISLDEWAKKSNVAKEKPQKKDNTAAVLNASFSSLPAAKKEEEKSDEFANLSTQANNFIRSLIKNNDCILITIQDSWHSFNFKTDPSFETLQQYAKILSDAGLKVTVKKASSLLDGLVTVPAKLTLDESLKMIVSKLSSYVTECQNLQKITALKI